MTLIQLKVQTRSPNPGPVQVVDSALIALNAELKTFKDRFEAADAKKKRVRRRFVE